MLRCAVSSKTVLSSTRANDPFARQAEVRIIPRGTPISSSNRRKPGGRSRPASSLSHRRRKRFVPRLEAASIRKLISTCLPAPINNSKNCSNCRRRVVNSREFAPDYKRSEKVRRTHVGSFSLGETMTCTCRAYWHTRGVIVSPPRTRGGGEKKKNRMAEKCNNAGEGCETRYLAASDARLPLWRPARRVFISKPNTLLNFSFYKWKLNTRLRGKFFSRCELCDT